MRKKKVILASTIVLVAFGLIIIGLALFAYQLGLDDTPSIGEKRKALLFFGFFLLLLRPILQGAHLIIKTLKQNKILHTLKQRIARRNPFYLPENLRNRVSKSISISFLKNHSWIWAVTGSILSILISAWYLTAGTFRLITPYSSYYDLQADAFLGGQLALIEEPPDELANLPDVYDKSQRDGIDYLWDASYYKGKYYLYWGPVPALVAAGIKIIKPMVVEDQALVLIFMSGLAITMAAFFHWLRKTFFPAAPNWLVFLFTLTSALCTPVLFLLSRPKVYEAAIASAQFFLILGLFGAVRGIVDEKYKTTWLALAGIGLGASVGSRFTNIFAVIFISIFLVLVLVKEIKLGKFQLTKLLGFIIPMTFFAIGLAWFNYARFGNILETGLRYQLTGYILPRDFKLTFSTGYLLPNSYSSLLRPFKFSPYEFPFFFSPRVTESMWPGLIHLPPTYHYGGPVVGVLTAIPFFWLLFFQIESVYTKAKNWINEVETAIPVSPVRLLRNKVIYLILGTALILLTTLMLYALSTMRFLVDFTPTWILLTGTSVFYIYTRLREKPGWKCLYVVLVFVLCAATIMIGLLLNLQSEDLRFLNNNPDLYKEILRLFTRN
jgi:hypothetical protein